MEPWREELYHSELYHYGVKGMKWKFRKKIPVKRIISTIKRPFQSAGRWIKRKTTNKTALATYKAQKAAQKGYAEAQIRNARRKKAFSAAGNMAGNVVQNPRIKITAKKAKIARKASEINSAREKKVAEGRKFLKEISRKYNFRKLAKRKRPR